jgi:hypothetical protein
MDGDLWDKVLDENNDYRRQLIDQVVSTALPESFFLFCSWTAPGLRVHEAVIVFGPLPLPLVWLYENCKRCPPKEVYP